MKYTFSTDFDNLYQNLGISEDRHDLFFDEAKNISIRAVMLDKTITQRGQAMEIYLNTIQPENMVEAFWAGCVFNDVFSQTESFAKKISSMASD